MYDGYPLDWDDQYEFLQFPEEWDDEYLEWELQQKLEEEETLDKAIAQSEALRIVQKMGKDPRREKVLDLRNLGGRKYTDGAQVLAQALGNRRARHTPPVDEHDEGIIPPSTKILGGWG